MPHSILIGGKPFMNYVTAVVMQFAAQDADQVVIKSRGKFISRSVDVSEVVMKRFLKDQVNLHNVALDSEQFTNKDGKTVRVSTIEITLAKKNPGQQIESSFIQSPAKRSSAAAPPQ